ncbi:class I SAM-dependent methyltransferase [Bellilinea sp.]|uniref:class I SAM-dependent methyltransferase n=1 Tax=Bellilinea sp. TaxID=2838785 RepID=UPI002ADE7FF1|nr:class I SAM-dependent methyltransferase [Bellilinea sp.]
MVADSKLTEKINLEYTNCNFCNCNEYVSVNQIPDLLLGNLSNKFSFVKCVNCGLIYQNPRVTQQDILKFYPDSYESYQPINLNSSWLMGKILRYGLQKRKGFVLKYRNSGKLLDIGCATGDFLDEVSHYGKNTQWDLYGVEISKYAAELASRKKYLNIFNTTLEDCGFPDHFFDVITLWDVLEHLYDPAGSLSEINRILKPGGLLILRVPNFNSLDRIIFQSEWAGWDAPRHLYVFSKKSITAFLERTGFSILNFNTNIGSYTTFLLSLRFFLTQKQKLDLNHPSKMISFLYSPLARIISAPLFYLVSKAGLGSLMVVTTVKEKSTVHD